MSITIPVWFLWVLIVWMALDLIEKASRLVLWWLKRRLVEEMRGLTREERDAYREIRKDVFTERESDET